MIARLLFLVSLWACLQVTGSSQPLTVAAYELSPYMSNEGEERGHLYEIITKAFANAGYKLDIQFYPPARAKALVRTCGRDLLVPSYSAAADSKDFAFSQPLHGSEITYVRWRDSKETKGSASVGVSARDWDDSSQNLHATSDNTVQLIDMLNQKRINFIIADKFVAANILVNKRPHLIGKLEFVDPPIIRKEFHVAFCKKKPGYRKALERFNAALGEMQRSGDYQRILMRYGYQPFENNAKVLSIATVANDDMKTMEELSRSFTREHPDVKLNWFTLEENLLRRRILASIALDDGLFDILTIGAYDTLIYAKNEWLQPLKTISKGYEIEDILPSARDSLSYQGQIYALPFYGESSMTFYRKDLFAKKGLTMPEHPRFSDIRHFAAKLHDPKQGVYGICLRGKAGWGENVALVTTIVNSFGGRWFNSKWVPEIDSAAWREAVEVYVDLLSNFGPPDAYRNGYNENVRLFAQGHCAMWVDATVAASYLFDRSKSLVADQVAYTHAPFGRNEEGSHWIWNWALGISKASKNKDLAQSFIEWATSRGYVELVAKEKGWLSVPPGTRISTYANSAYQKAAPFAKFVFDAMQSLKPMKALHPDIPYQGVQFVEIPEWPALGNSVGTLLSNILKDRMSVAEALERSQQEARRIMYHSGYYSSLEAGAAR